MRPEKCTLLACRTVCLGRPVSFSFFSVGHAENRAWCAPGLDCGQAVGPLSEACKATKQASMPSIIEPLIQVLKIGIQWGSYGIHMHSRITVYHMHSCICSQSFSSFLRQDLIEALKQRRGRDMSADLWCLWKIWHFGSKLAALIASYCISLPNVLALVQWYSWDAFHSIFLKSLIMLLLSAGFARVFCALGDPPIKNIKSTWWTIFL